jgi:hypothetical protein
MKTRKGRTRRKTTVAGEEGKSGRRKGEGVGQEREEYSLLPFLYYVHL